MKLILKIALRNLLRQKRRNLFLGIGIALGMSFLFIANSFAAGMSDILLNKIIVWITGHVRISMVEQNDRPWQMIRDKNRLIEVVNSVYGDDVEVFEDVMTEGRAIGNNSSEFIYLKGLDLNEGYFRDMQIEAGNPEDITNKNIENPVILYSETAKDLNVQVNDVLQVGFETVYKQVETARFTVIAIIKGDMPFLEMAAFTHLNTLKPLLGYAPEETGSLNLIFKRLESPKIVNEKAQLLHDALHPGLAGFVATMNAHNKSQKLNVVSIDTNTNNRSKFMNSIRILSGSIDKCMANSHNILLDSISAYDNNILIGDTVVINYESRFSGISPDRKYCVGAIYSNDEMRNDNVAFVNPQDFYETFFPLPPKTVPDIKKDLSFYPLLLKEWELLDRSESKTAFETKYEELEFRNWRGAVLDVQTMNELASDVLKLQYVLNVLTIIGVLILFIIIIIGVVNTLRMTIRERTREIGTVRAIGMQQKEVQTSYICEIILLTFFSCTAGIFLGLFIMKMMSLISFNAYGIFTIILVNKHLYFHPTILDVLRNLLIISTIAFITSYFPARKAAKTLVADALRFYE